MSKAIERRACCQMELARDVSDSTSRRVEGYALLFNTLSIDLGGFVEQIAPTALDGVVARSDVFAFYNHDQRAGVLARCNHGKGTLTLTVDDKGLRYAFDAPHSPVGDNLLESLRRGDISQSSFAFSDVDDEWSLLDDGTPLCTITRIGLLHDVSPVLAPAYRDTTVSARSLEVAKRMAEGKDEEEDNPDDRDHDRGHDEINDDKTPESEENPKESEENPKESEETDEKEKKSERNYKNILYTF